MKKILKIRKIINLHPKNLQNISLRGTLFMNKDKKWMLMTYYCPTHGDPGRVEPLEITRQEILGNLLNEAESKE